VEESLNRHFADSYESVKDSRLGQLTQTLLAGVRAGDLCPSARYFLIQRGRSANDPTISPVFNQSMYRCVQGDSKADRTQGLLSSQGMGSSDMTWMCSSPHCHSISPQYPLVLLPFQGLCAHSPAHKRTSSQPGDVH
jgi:hypothetical protein